MIVPIILGVAIVLILGVVAWILDDAYRLATAFDAMLADLHERINALEERGKYQNEGPMSDEQKVAGGGL